MKPFLAGAALLGLLSAGAAQASPTAPAIILAPQGAWQSWPGAWQQDNPNYPIVVESGVWGLHLWRVRDYYASRYYGLHCEIRGQPVWHIYYGWVARKIRVCY
jgi:hypothetical protein